MDPVGTPSAWGHFVLNCLTAKDRAEISQGCKDNVQAFGQEEGGGCVYDVAARQAKVDISARLPYALCHV